MTPEDDPTWPECSANCTDFLHSSWCDEVRDLILKGEDAEQLDTGIRVCVPMWPKQELYAEVSIDAEEIIPGAARLSLVKSEMFTNDESLIPIGLWNRGEGRASISSTLQDWLRGQGKMTCPNRAHGFKEEQELTRTGPSQVQWCIQLHDMCYPCYCKSQGFVNTMQTSIADATDGQRTAPAMQRLQSRFQ